MCGRRAAGGVRGCSVTRFPWARGGCAERLYRPSPGPGPPSLPRHQTGSNYAVRSVRSVCYASFGGATSDDSSEAIATTRTAQPIRGCVRPGHGLPALRAPPPHPPPCFTVSRSGLDLSGNQQHHAANDISTSTRSFYPSLAALELDGSKTDLGSRRLGLSRPAGDVTSPQAALLFLPLYHPPHRSQLTCLSRQFRSHRPTP